MPTMLSMAVPLFFGFQAIAIGADAKPRNLARIPRTGGAVSR
jgi:hypothetical protein